MPITSLKQLDLSKQYTYADYLKWQFKERVELLKGKVFRMSPAPSREHQELVSNLHGYIWNFLNQQTRKTCRVYPSPFDVRLPLNTEGKETVVQPDVTVVCDESKLDKQGCVGAPELVVEVLSPGNSEKEMKHKFELYEQAGVLEYWIVDPTHQTILLYTLQTDGKYESHPPYTFNDHLKSTAISGFEVKLSNIFETSSQSF